MILMAVASDVSFIVEESVFVRARGTGSHAPIFRSVLLLIIIYFNNIFTQEYADIKRSER